MSVVCLDFDGVLCDSAEECLVVGHNAYYGRKALNPGEIDPALRDYFLRHRYLVAPANDFYLLIHGYEQGAAPIDRPRYDELRAANRDACAAFGPRFFACRDELKQDEPHWLGLHRLYAESRIVLDDAFPTFYVVTTKDADSVRRLAAFHGYGEKIRAIYGKEVATNKRLSFQKLFADLGDASGRHGYLFVDDNIDHLAQVADLPVKPHLAGWGYVDPKGAGPFPRLNDLGELRF